MKQVFQNRYLKAFQFASFQEMSKFIANQEAKNYLYIDDSVGDICYCYILYHSLTRKKQLVLSFNSDEKEDNLNFMYWDNMFIFDTAKKIYIIDESMNIKASVEIDIYLIGLYLLEKNMLLILEEASYKIINTSGEVLKSEKFDLIEDFRIKNNILNIKANNKEIMIYL